MHPNSGMLFMCVQLHCRASQNVHQRAIVKCPRFLRRASLIRHLCAITKHGRFYSTASVSGHQGTIDKYVSSHRRTSGIDHQRQTEKCSQHHSTGSDIARTEGIHVTPVVKSYAGRQQTMHDIFSQLLKEKKIFIFGYITHRVAELVNAQILFLEKQKVLNPVELYINSPGGSLSAALSIYNTLVYSRAPVSTWCLGQACNEAALLLSAGEPGDRNVFAHSRIILNGPLIQDEADEDAYLHTKADEFLVQRHLVTEAFSEVTCQSPDVINDILGRTAGASLDLEEARHLGFIDNVLISPELPRVITGDYVRKRIKFPKKIRRVRFFA